MGIAEAGHEVFDNHMPTKQEPFMDAFVPEHVILLTDDELQGLVSARNRADYQPELKAFLYATRKMRMLRRLSYEPNGDEWGMAPFTVSGDGGILDSDGAVRGHRREMELPARPGELQMALSHDWLWSLFCDALIRKGVWAYLTDRELIRIEPVESSVSVEAEWTNLWDRLASKAHLRQSLSVFLNYRSLFKMPSSAWNSKSIPIVSEDIARYLIHYYQFGKYKKKHFKSNSIPNAISDLENVIENKCYDTIPMYNSAAAPYTKGGDFWIGEKIVRCLGCGEILVKKEGYKRISLFLKDTDERPQSGRGKEDYNTFCKRCVAILFYCPIKLCKETLTVRFDMPQYKNQRSAEMELRKFVAHTLHIHAGSFINLHVTEKGKKDKMLPESWGAYVYSLWKMAATFPPELFAQGFHISVFPGEERFKLSNWALWIVSSLLEWDNFISYQFLYGKSKNDLLTSMGEFLRLVSRKKIFQAFYVLFSSQLIQYSYIYDWRINRLQEIWKDFETRLQEEEEMPIPDYPKIAGFTGLLLPLADRVQSSHKDPSERKRAVGKLLEEADKPIQYAYTAARESGSTEFIFCKRPRNRFFYEKALDILKWAGEDVKTLQNEGERIVNEQEAFKWARDDDEKIFIGPSQIARVTSALVSEGEKPYESEADWRAFAYQVKLALWSMFPQHLGSQDKQGKES